MTHKSHHLHPHPQTHTHSHAPAHSNHHPTAKRAPFFSKIFRWQTDKPGGPLPIRVEIVGSFTNWQKTALKYDRTNGIWQVTLENIPGNCTHNYMLLVNGRPTHDKNSDGLAVPHTDQEKAHQLETPRGPRVFMLFSQTK
jgi:1,4-alpha-glucan branching enzyme